MDGVVTQGSVIAFQALPGGEDVVGSADESKKRGCKEVDQDVQAKKKQKPDSDQALATKSRIMKLDQGLKVSSAVKIPNKAPTAACKCDSCGRIMCICLKSRNSLGSDASTLTDCHVKNTSGSQASKSDPNCNGSVSSKNEEHGCVSYQLDKPSSTALLDNELKTVCPALPPFFPERTLRAAMLTSKYAGIIEKAQGKAIHQSDKADLIRIEMEKEQIERTQLAEKDRIEAEMRDAKIAALKQQRERERHKLEKMKADIELQEKANQLRLEEDFVNVCGCSTLTRARLLFEEWGLVLRNDDCPELEESKSANVDAMAMAMRVDGLEEGEIDPLEFL